MNEESRLSRYAPLAGVVMFALVAASFVLSNDTPNSDDSVTKVVKYWHDNKDDEMLSAFLGSYAVLFFLWYAGALKAAIARAEGGVGRLASLTFGGAIVFASGILANNALEFVTANTADERNVPPQVTQTLSALYSDFFIPIAIGFGLFSLAAGIATVRFGPLPKWMGWVAIVAGVAVMTPAWPAIFVILIWILVSSILLFLRGGAPAGPEAPAAPVVPPPAGAV